MVKKEKGRALNPIDQQDPNAGRFGTRKLQLQIYGLVSALALTVALIAILEYINRSLPDGSKTRYSSKLPVRDLSDTHDYPILGIRDESSTFIVDSNVTPTQVFVPLSTTTTISMAQCPVLPLTCACPQDGEIPNCNCTPDTSATFCTCAVKIIPTCGCDPVKDSSCECGPNPYYRDCVCPPDSMCNRCMCPSTRGSFYEPCPCPQSPLAAGCRPNPREPTCSTFPDECGCSVVEDWRCGPSATRSDCSTPTSTIGGVFNSVITVIPVFNTNNPSTVSSTSTPSDPSSSRVVVHSSTNLEASASPFPSFPRPLNSTLGTSKPTSTDSPTPEAPLTIPTIFPIPTSSQSPPQGGNTVLGSMTASVGGTDAPISASGSSIPTSAGPGISLGPGAIILVSSSLVPATTGLGSFSVVAVTFVQTTPLSSASIITDPAGSVFTIPSHILAPTPALTSDNQATSVTSPGPVPLRSVTPSLIPVTSPASASSAVSIPSTTLLASPLLVSLGTTATGSSSNAHPFPNSQEDFSMTGSSSNMLTSEADVATSKSLEMSSSLPSSSLDTTNPSLKATAAQESAQNEVTSVSKITGGGGDSTSTPSPTPSTGSTPLQVAIYSWPISKTVVGGYIPVLVSRLFLYGWTAIYKPLSHNEALRQLAGQHGASSSILFGTGAALWYIWPAHAASWFISPFASEMIYFDTNYACSNPDLNNQANPCWPPVTSVNVWVVRVLQTLLALVAFTIIVLIALWFRRPAAHAADPTSIAAVAAIMGHPEVARDFKAFDADASTNQLRQELKEKTYQLGTYMTETNTERYGIIPLNSENPNIQVPDPTIAEDGLPSSAAVSRMKMGFSFITNWKRFQLGSDVTFTLFLLGIVGAAILYVSHINNLMTIHLFEGSVFGRRFLFACLACIASSYWSRLQRDAQTLAPYAELAYPNEAAPERTILLRKHSLAITALFPLLRHRHFIAALIAFTAILSDFLIITFSGLPYRPGQLRSEFLFCGIASLVILTFMLIMLLVVNLWRMLSVPHLPRKPDNIAAVMTYVCDSVMNRDFEGLERVKVKERDMTIRGLGKKYRYGARKCRDGKERWVVDEVEKVDESAS